MRFLPDTRARAFLLVCALCAACAPAPVIVGPPPPAAIQPAIGAAPAPLPLPPPPNLRSGEPFGRGMAAPRAPRVKCKVKTVETAGHLRKYRICKPRD